MWYLKINKKSVGPVIHDVRKVPLSIQSNLRDTLDQLVKDDIIQRTETPTEWVNNLVVVEKKNGSLRLCLDPKDLNLAVKREHYKIPTSDDISSRLMEKNCL